MRMVKDFITANWKLILAFVAAGFLVFICLGKGGIPAAQEGRTAIIVENMLRTGNFLDMQAGEGIPYEKPIGHYWLCVPSAVIFGMDHTKLNSTLNEWAVRFPSAVSFLLTLAAAAILSWRIYGRKTAPLTVFVLATMMTFLHLGRLAHIDMPLACAFAWSMVFLYIGYMENLKSNCWIYGFYAFLGWGMLLKGPLVLILAGLTVLAMMGITRRWKMIREIRPLTGALVFLIIALPWYIMESIRTDGAFFEEFIVKQNIQRFTGVHSTYRDGERMSLFYYIPKLFAGAAPWSIFAVAAFILNIKRFIRLKFSRGSLFLLSWFVTGFVFFSLSALKRGDYLLPIYPALGILTAAAISAGCEKLPPLTKHWIWGWLVLAAVAVTGIILSLSGVFIRIGEAALSDKGIIHLGKTDAQNFILISGFLNEHILLTLLGAVLLLGLLWLFGWFMQHGKYKLALMEIIKVVLVIYAVSNSWLDPMMADELRSVKNFVQEVKKKVPSGTPILYSGGYNTELVYFMGSDLQRGKLPVEPGAYVIVERQWKRKLSKEPDVQNWEYICGTVDKHQYEAHLLRRKAPQTPEH